MLDYDQDGWPDVLVANDTQPNKLYRNLHNGKFKDVAVEAGLAFSMEGKARAGMGVDVADFDNSGKPGIVITNFDNEMIGLYREAGKAYDDVAMQTGLGDGVAKHVGFGCVFFDADLDGLLDIAVANGQSTRRCENSWKRRLRATAATVHEPGRRKISRRGSRSGRRIRSTEGRTRIGGWRF